MESFNIEFAIEGLVAILLLLTIAFCLSLNSRLKRLKIDEGVIKQAIYNLDKAATRAEDAVASMREAAAERQEEFAQQIRDAEKLTHELAAHRAASNAVLNKLASVAEAAGQPVSKRKPGQLGVDVGETRNRILNGRAA